MASSPRVTPGRPVSLEATAGKNPVTHVGKIYNIVAREIAEALIGAVPKIIAAQCLLVSRIGSPVTQPALADVKIATRTGIPVGEFRRPIEEVTADCLARIPHLLEDFVAGKMDVF
jgi:S-adenosylmethionine synthetase